MVGTSVGISPSLLFGDTTYNIAENCPPLTSGGGHIIKDNKHLNPSNHVSI